MHFEVEQKFALDSVADVEQRLRALDAREVGVIEQSDLYFNHPARDFAKTDEALRLRSVGDEHFITYKGPKLDATTKTRQEMELPLARGAGVADEFGRLLEALGFRPAGSVHKIRRRFAVAWQGKTVEVALDQVEGLGLYLELELMATQGEMEAAKSAIATLATELGFFRSQRRSYLELLLDRQGPTIAT